MLLSETFDAFDQARLALRDQAILSFGKETGPVIAQLPGIPLHASRRADPRRPRCLFTAQDGWVSPGRFDTGGRSVCPKRRVGDQRSGLFA
jgi:hypothetical protein